MCDAPDPCVGHLPWHKHMLSWGPQSPQQLFNSLRRSGLSRTWCSQLTRVYAAGLDSACVPRHDVCCASMHCWRCSVAIANEAQCLKAEARALVLLSQPLHMWHSLFVLPELQVP